jgi:hypothetical protein
MTAAEAVGFALVLLGGMAGLIKALILGRLDKIDKKLDKQSDQLANHDGRLIRIEEWRANLPLGALGRRAQDHCAAPECPHEASR